MSGKNPGQLPPEQPLTAHVDAAIPVHTTFTPVGRCARGVAQVSIVRRSMGGLSGKFRRASKVPRRQTLCTQRLCRPRRKMGDFDCHGIVTESTRREAAMRVRDWSYLTLARCATERVGGSASPVASATKEPSGDVGRTPCTNWAGLAPAPTAHTHCKWAHMWPPPRVLRLGIEMMPCTSFINGSRRTSCAAPIVFFRVAREFTLRGVVRFLVHK